MSKEKFKPVLNTSVSREIEAFSVQTILEENLKQKLKYLAFSTETHWETTESHGYFGLNDGIKAFYILWEGSDIKRIRHWFVP